MKLYDTQNGTFVSEIEVEKTEIIQAVFSGEYDDHQLENWTIEGTEVGDSTALGDLKIVAYAYFSGDSGSVIACSDGRHVDTLWGTGCWDKGDDTAHRETWDSRFESLKAEMELYEQNNIEDTVDPGELYAEAAEIAYNCVSDEITELYPEAPEYVPDAEYCIQDYVGDHIGWSPKSTR